MFGWQTSAEDENGRKRDLGEHGTTEFESARALASAHVDWARSGIL